VGVLLKKKPPPRGASGISADPVAILPTGPSWAAMSMARQYSEDEGRDRGDGSGADEFVELDLDKTLTWTGNSVIVQRGAVFRMPLLVPQPSVLAIQFEIEGGYDIEFSLTFKEDNEEESVVMVRTAESSLIIRCPPCRWLPGNPRAPLAPRQRLRVPISVCVSTYWARTLRPCAGGARSGD
jgi:hypothetical protein